MRTLNTYKFSILVIILLITFACSTEKNTFINRTYHSTTARYNGYFNAKELIRLGLEEYERSYRENFYEILPIRLLPNEEDVIDFYPVVDTAIAKCQTVIGKHSMPTASKPSKKKTEYARWVDMNWLLIAEAQYIRRDYQNALDNFEYVRKFYSDRSSTYYAQLGEAKTQIALGLYADAQRTLQKLDNRYQNYLADLEGGNEIAYRLEHRKALNSKDKKSEKAPPFPKKLHREIELTKAKLAIAQKDKNKAIIHLEEGLKTTRGKKNKARLHFILGQLKQEKGDDGARKHYSEVVRLNAPFEMTFNAKINKATSGGAPDDDVISELRKMLKEQKYIDYKDQIYFAMAKVELDRPDQKQAKYYLTRSAFTSINNNRQKGMSYEKLGDLAFNDRNYVHAQKYFDSSANVIPDTYPNAEVIRAKAEQLSSLVRNIDIVSLEDSLQRIANMGESERERFLEQVIEDLKEKERLRKEKEAQRAEELKKLQQSLAAKDASSSTFYFSNVKAIDEGFEEFRQLWGIRENEDNWRRSTKDLVLDFDEESFDEDENDSIQKPVDPSLVPVDELTPEILMVNIPLTDSAMAVSNERLLEALYRAGMIYKEQLEEPKMGGEQFQRVIDHGVENEHNVLAAFQLYQLNKDNNPTAAEVHKQYIMNHYPNTDYANYLRDPDYFIKKKELDALAQKEYLRSVERFERGLYFPVIMKAETVIENEPDNIYRAQYFILKAMAMGQLNSDKTSLIPILEQAIEEYPDTPIAERAKELLGYIINGVPAYEPIDFSSGSSIYNYGSKDKMFVIIVLNEKDDSRQSLTKISDFTREYYSRDRLKPSSQILNDKVTLIKIGEFRDEYHAQDYLRDYKKTKKHLGDLNNRKILFISPDNFKTLLKERKLEDYEKFFNDNY